MDSEQIKTAAREAGFELCGVARAEPTLESAFYPEWISRGFHGKMGYLEGPRGEMRADPRTLLPSARSVICVGQVYNAPYRYSTEADEPEKGWVARYAWGRDYHDTMKNRLHGLARTLRDEAGDFEYKVCVDTSPILERAYAHRAGLGWIAKNTCLINEQIGSWVLLGEILTSLELDADEPAPFRCGTCTRCIDACPTDAFVEIGDAGPSHALDARRCISYWTIELKGEIPEENRGEIGRHVFGCDICQDVCPWNRPARAATTDAEEFQPANAEPSLEELATMTQEQFNDRFAGTPIERSRYAGFLRNVAVAMGNSGNPEVMATLERLAEFDDPNVRVHALWALRKAEGDKAR
ncbi:MAG: tRNA epoxyqueuosine(34) reductase QueG [Acidobacteria bacterium]|nr:tRNA epoxyqueuosine(34) reductase QueG [Acidobacteriota bacterium]MDA1237159.1 tRNA epoxyqueuosine(34) reductase QueG [Acidobacteriota bacterium]